MDKSTESLSDSDSNTSTSWVFVDETITSDGDANSNQFFLNCSQEPVQELTEHDLGAIGSDIDSDTDGISVISESEENQPKDGNPEESSDDGVVVVPPNATVDEKTEEVEKVEEMSGLVPLPRENAQIPGKIPWRKLFSTSSILGSSLVIFAIFLSPYMSATTEKQLEDTSPLNDDNNNQLDNYDYLFDKKVGDFIFKGECASTCSKKIAADNAPGDYIITKRCIKDCRKTNHERALRNIEAAVAKTRQLNQMTEPHHLKEKKIKKEHKAKREAKFDGAKQKHKHKKSENREEKSVAKQEKKKCKKEKRGGNEKIGEILTSVREKIKNDIDKFFEREKALRVKERYLLKKEKYLMKMENKLRKKASKIAKKFKIRGKSPEKGARDDFLNKVGQRKVLIVQKNRPHNNSVEGDWYYNLHKGRNEYRKKERAGEWFFDRAHMRSKKRDKAHWYFQWMTDRAQLRFKRSYRPFSS